MRFRKWGLSDRHHRGRGIPKAHPVPIRIALRQLQRPVETFWFACCASGRVEFRRGCQHLRNADAQGFWRVGGPMVSLMAGPVCFS